MQDQDRRVSVPAFLAMGCVGFIASAQPVAAQQAEKPETLGRVTVTDSEVAEGSYRTEAASNARLTEPLLNTPRTITVLPEAMLRDQAVVSFADALRNVPGITIGVGEGGAGSGDFITLRGFDASSDVTIDGFADRLQQTRSDLFNYEAIEVIKGPNSAVGGAGGASGQINLVSKAPRLEDRVILNGSLGSADYRRLQGDANLALKGLVPNAAIRLNAVWHDQGMAGRDEVFQRRMGFAPSIAFGLDTPTRATLSYMWQSDDNRMDYGIPFGLTGERFPISRANYYGVLGVDQEHQVTQIATLKLEHDFSSAVRIANVTRWGKVTREAVWTTPQNRNTAGAPGLCAPNPDCTFASAVQAIEEGRYAQALYITAGPQGLGRMSENRVLVNQTNLTANVETGPVAHTIVFGGEIGREDFERGTINVGGLANRLVNLYAPDPVFTGPLTWTRTPGQYDVRATRGALWAFDTLKFGDRFQLNGGVRWERFVADYGGTALVANRQVNNLWSWQGAAIFKPVENGTLYLSYTDAKQPQALASTATGAVGTAVNPPLMNRNFELGTKWDVAGGGLSLTAALFRTERTNEAITNSDGNTEFVGKRRVQGLELSASGQITPDWSVFAAYAFLDSKILRASATVAGQLTEGESLTATPKHSGSLWTTYALPFGLTLGGGLQYVGETPARQSSATIAAWSFDPVTIVNAMASYKFSDRVSLQLNATNLFDEFYIQRPRVTDTYAFGVPGEGRKIIGTLTFTY